MPTGSTEHWHRLDQTGLRRTPSTSIALKDVAGGALRSPLREPAETVTSVTDKVE